MYRRGQDILSIYTGPPGPAGVIEGRLSPEMEVGGSSGCHLRIITSGRPLFPYYLRAPVDGSYSTETLSLILEEPTPLPFLPLSLSISYQLLRYPSILHNACSFITTFSKPRRLLRCVIRAAVEPTPRASIVSTPGTDVLHCGIRPDSSICWSEAWGT